MSMIYVDMVNRLCDLDKYFNLLYSFKFYYIYQEMILMLILISFPLAISHLAVKPCFICETLMILDP